MSNGKLGESLGMRLSKNGMLFMIIVIIVMTGIMITANTNYQYRATLPGNTYHVNNVRWT